MQSQTPVSPAEYDRAMILAGKWCYNHGNAEAQDLYSKLYGNYLTNGGMATAQPPARPAQPRSAGSRTQAQAGTRSQAGTRPPRTRTADGTPGSKVARVLAKIVATPSINIEGLRKTFARSMEPNVIGTALGRLFKAGHISGTPKVGPFTATAAGIEANNKQPTSINTRRRTTGKTTPVTEPAGQMQQTG